MSIEEINVGDRLFIPVLNSGPWGYKRGAMIPVKVLAKTAKRIKVSFLSRNHLACVRFCKPSTLVKNGMTHCGLSEPKERG